MLQLQDLTILFPATLFIMLKTLKLISDNIPNINYMLVLLWKLI